MSPEDNAREWPALPLEEWEATYRTLQLWTQIVGKVRLTLTPKVNHWWNCALYVTPRGLTTSAIPYRGSDFELEFNFLDHRLDLSTSGGKRDSVPLALTLVATFYREVMAMLTDAGIEVAINTTPQELPDPVPFDQDDIHKSYDAEYAQRFWRILLSTDTVLHEFRSRFVGKCSPVHFFWGSFDICCTRFNGKRAPARKGVITSEAYSHECSSIGWWPGGGDMKGAAFYAYNAPAPKGYGTQPAKPASAFYNDKMSEYFLMYDDVRRDASPRKAILDFAQSTYEIGADLADWDRAPLER
jgi:Family of unknown function (DUF5996)